ncbi:MAG: type II toxin-antitoxin system RelE/ParE family toxin [Thermomicrobiales bacterium]
MTSSISLGYSRRALSNITEIFQYTHDTWGSDQEGRYKDILDNAFDLIQRFPDIGHPVEGRQSSIRAYHLRHHIIEYRREPDRIVILRIVSPRRGHR